MCLAHQVTCTCGKSSASMHAKDSILPVDVVQRLFCPVCSGQTVFDPATMLADNGWIIEYNMDMARFMLQKVSPVHEVSPEFLFDEGYFTWNGVHPHDIVESARERQELVKLAQTDRKRYFEEFKNWGVKRMERLAREGWRKAHERENVHT